VTTAQAFALDAFWATNTGRARDHNEDAIGGTPLDYPAAATRGYLFIVADGMGGHNAGEVASNEAAKRVYQRYYADGEPDVFRSLERIMRATNDQLYQQAQANPAQRGMGTTMTTFVIKDNHLTAAHVGDSRLYLIRGGKIEQVTHDHSWVEEQVRAGVLTRLQAESHPQRNVITRALATTPDVRVDPFNLDLQVGDILVFCSDGLNTEVGDPQIAALATKATSAEVAVGRLIQLANENGGEDNISVGVIRVLEAAAAPIAAAATAVPVAAPNAAPRKAPILPIIGGIAALVVVVGVVVAFGSSLMPPKPPAVATLASTPTQVIPTVTPISAVAGQPAAPVSRPTAVEPITQSVATAILAPIAGATSTLMPTSTPAPSATARPPTLLVGGRGAATPTPPPQGAPPGPAKVAAPLLLAPPPNETVKGRITVQWQAVDLPPGAAYEVVWWRPDADPNTAKGFAPPTTATTQAINTTALDLPSGQTFIWAVLVVQTNPFARLVPPAEANHRPLVFKCSEKCDSCTTTDPVTGETKTEPCNCKLICD
jgi:serine/threonine protein phosphatase PrpC